MRNDILSADENAFVAACSRAPSVAAEDGGAAAHARRGLRGSTAISVEFAEGERLAAVEADWLDLLGRTASANVFMTPSAIKTAAEVYHDRSRFAFLAWRNASTGKQLIGIWGFAIGRPPQSILPLDVLTAPPTGHAYLATPVIDRDHLEDVLQAILDAIAGDSCLPNVVALQAMAADDPTMQALMRVLAARSGAPCFLATTNRPKLASTLDGKQYLQRALSGGTRKKLRQQRRRLAEKGSVEFCAAIDPKAVMQSFEAFLQLEVAGWKGRQKTALLSKLADATFARAMIAGLAQRGDAAIYALNLNGRPLSMQVVLHAGSAAFTWKTAYDEDWRDFSPGMLLFEEYTAAFLADDRIAYVDSCAYDETSFMAAWTERQAIADLWFDARPGRQHSFAVMSRLQMAYGTIRSLAKRAHKKYTRHTR